MKNKNRGFTLIELVLSLAVSSILILSLNSILNFTINTCNLGNEMDEILLNGQYAIEYIKKEIRQAEKIISIDKFEGLDSEYSNNLGFVIMRYFPNDNFKYNYSTYYLKNNKIYRIAKNREDDVLPKFSLLDGHNEVAEHVVSMEGTNINFETMVINLKFILEGETGKMIEFKSKLFIRCPVIY